MMTSLLMGLAVIAGTVLIIVLSTGAARRRPATGAVTGSVAYMGHGGADCGAGSDGGCDGSGGGCDGGGGGGD